MFSDCGPPPNVLHADYNSSISTTTVGAIVVYECDNGYTLSSGELIIACRSNGTWDGYGPICVAGLY